MAFIYFIFFLNVCKFEKGQKNCGCKKYIPEFFKFWFGPKKIFFDHFFQQKLFKFQKFEAYLLKIRTFWAQSDYWRLIYYKKVTFFQKMTF